MSSGSLSPERPEKEGREVAAGWVVLRMRMLFCIFLDCCIDYQPGKRKLVVIVD